jgi:hypothetical protein
MRLPRMRFTLRRMMVVVAILAMAFAIPDAIERRRSHFRDLASIHTAKAESYGRQSGPSSVIIYRSAKPPGPAEEARSRRKYAMIFYHSGLESKYRAAATRPWLPVFPDPPEPK